MAETIVKQLGDQVGAEFKNHRVRLEALESTTGSATSFSGTITGDIIPDVADMYTLGSIDKPFKDLFVGANSLYVDGQKVIQSDAGTITVTADTDQNVQLKTSGGGDVEFYPSGTGVIQLKGSVQIPSGKVLMTTDNLPLQVGNGMNVDGNVTADNINTMATDVASLKALVQSDNSNLDTIQEIVSFIELNKATLDTLGITNIAGLQTALNAKVNVSDTLTYDEFRSEFEAALL